MTPAVPASINHPPAALREPPAAIGRKPVIPATTHTRPTGMEKVPKNGLRNAVRTTAPQMNPAVAPITGARVYRRQPPMRDISGAARPTAKPEAIARGVVQKRMIPSSPGGLSPGCPSIRAAVRAAELRHSAAAAPLPAKSKLTRLVEDSLMASSSVKDRLLPAA